MIQRLQNSNINFRSAQHSPALQATIGVQAPASKAEIVEEPKKKFSIKEAYAKTKKTVTDGIKGFNNVTNIGGGIARGVVEGSIATAAVGVLGKSFKEAPNHDVIKFFGNIVSDLSKGVANTFKFIPSIITKSPLENVKTILTLPKKFYTGYLKGNKAIAGVATVIGLAVLAYRALQGKIHANEKNAGIDHKTNQGHV